MTSNYIHPSDIDEDTIDFTNTQTLMYVLVNFAMAGLLLVAVNSNLESPCNAQMKYWLLLMALILASNSLV
jgi:hypothetical protein